MKKITYRRVLSAVLALLLLISLLPVLEGQVQAAEYTGCLSQHDSRWGSYNVGGGTISGTACGILSLVNTVGYLSGQQMDVISTAIWAHNVGGYNVGGANGVWRLDLYPLVEAKYGSTYGIKMDCGSDGNGYWEGSNSLRLKNHLLDGGVAIGHVPNHFISIVGYDAITNKYHIYDSSAAAHRGTNYNGGDVWVTEAALTQGSMYLDWFCLLSSTRVKETWIEKAAFDVMVYRDRNPDLAGLSDSELKAHWRKYGIKEGRASSTILDLGFYLGNNPDLKEAFGTNYEAAYNHFITTGYKEYRKSSALFDGYYYTQAFPEVVTAFKDEYLRHYVDHGMAEGRRASLTYDPLYYQFIRPDVAQTWPGDYAMAARHYAGHGINAQIEAYDHSAPTITNATISDVTAAGYTVSCTVTDDWGINRVVFPTWTAKNDQDDLADDFMNTQKGTKNGDTYTFRVNASDHNKEGGSYITHIYAVDKGGNKTQLVLDPVEVKDPAPKEITLISSASYKTEKSLLKNVAASTSVKSLLTQFENKGLEVVNSSGTAITGSALVGTGTKVNLYDGDELVDSITVVVPGDVNGDGAVDSTDYVRVKSAFLGSFTLSTAQNSAADVDVNNTLDATDYLRIKAHFLGSYII